MNLLKCFVDTRANELFQIKSKRRWGLGLGSWNAQG